MANILRTSIRLTFIWTGAFLIVSIVFTDLRTIAAGVMLGGIVSAFNAYLLGRRTEMLGQAALGGNFRRVGIGTGLRAAMVLFAALVASKYPDVFHLPTVLLSCFVVQVTALFVAIRHNKRDDGKG